MDLRKRGATSQMVRIFIPDNSVTTGAGVTGLTFESTNLRVSFIREKDSALTSYTGANIETITTIGTFQAPSSSSKCRFKETPIPGVYEIHFHDSATVFGAADASEKVIVLVAEDTTTALKIGPNAKEIQLTAFDLQTAIQKADLETIKTQAVTCAAPLTVLASVGTAAASTAQTGDSFAIVNGDHGLISIQDDIDTLLARIVGTLLAGNHTAQSGDGYAILNNGTYGNSALQTLLTTIAGYLDTEIGDILADTNEMQGDLVNGGRLDLLIDAIKAVLDKLDTAMELDVAVYRFTANALEQAPTGGSAPTVEQIRTEIDSNSTQLAAITAKTTNLPTDPADESLIIAATDAIMTRLGAPAGASVSADIAAITSNLGTIVPTTDSADSVTLTTGTAISGSYANTQTDDDVRYVLAPVNPGGLDMTLIFNIVGARAPVSLSINGYWSGSGQYCNVSAYDYILGVWDQLTNSTTRMGSRNSDANYSYPLNREHIDPDTGEISIRFVSPSTNTAHRLNLDRVLVATVDISGGDSPGISAQDVWSHPERTLTSDSGEPVDTDAIAAAAAAAILVTPSQKVVTDASGYVTANVNGSITVTGDVTLAASQPNYAPAKAGDAMALTSAYDPAKTAAQASDIPTANITAIKAKTDNLPSDPADESLIIAATDAISSAIAALPASSGDATAVNQTAILAAIAALPAPGDATAATQALILAAVQGGVGSGSGSVSWPITIKDATGDPIADVDVTIVAHGDADLDPVASGKTDSYGVLHPTPMLDPGTYDVYRQKTGVDFTNPSIIIVVA
jgi:hypothetical protein